MSAFDLTLLLGSAVALVAVAAARLGSRAGVPALLLFLFVGIGLGSSGLGIDFSDATMAHNLGFAALVLILAEGGLTTKWSSVKPVLGMGLMLATVGSLVTIAVVGLFGYFVLGLPRSVAFLFGAVVAPTDAAAVFAVLRAVPLPPTVRAALEAESGFNDAPTVLLVIAGTNYAIGVQPAGGVIGLAGTVVLELASGVLLGIVMGWLGVQIMKRLSLPASGLYPLATMAWIVFTYGLGELAHGSAFAAVFVCAMILGNAQLPHRHATRSFAEGIGWVAQIGLFVMLGLLIEPSRITLHDVLIGLLLVAVISLFARPAAVFVSVVWFHVPWREQTFLSWAGLRGAVPIILATVPLASQMPKADELFDIIVIFVIVSTLVQAPSLPIVARWLGLENPYAATDVDIEVAPFEERRADLLQVNIPAGSKLAGVAVRELRLPPNAIVALIIRGDESFSPEGHTTLLKGDEVLVVTPANVRDKVERRLTDLGRGGRLAMWHRGGRRWTRAQRRAHAQARRLQAQADKQAGTAQ
ncbi:potassium/proton antiporter [Propionibacterium freudenreichii]|uniref:potassium/proton antiporter n=1 Tax=Propionibacterium freudenreichii TaxID=1744 RepID=UPI0024345C4D|nr:potassium/proton antiporter [Propionibacterium freudenreichii]WFF32556.1 potassium/proton antiporter [Propionibacterium freudenreichii]